MLHKLQLQILNYAFEGLIAYWMTCILMENSVRAFLPHIINFDSVISLNFYNFINLIALLLGKSFRENLVDLAILSFLLLVARASLHEHLSYFLLCYFCFLFPRLVNFYIFYIGVWETRHCFTSGMDQLRKPILIFYVVFNIYTLYKVSLKFKGFFFLVYTYFKKMFTTFYQTICGPRKLKLGEAIKKKQYDRVDRIESRAETVKSTYEAEEKARKDAKAREADKRRKAEEKERREADERIEAERKRREQEEAEARVQRIGIRRSIKEDEKKAHQEAEERRKEAERNAGGLAAAAANAPKKPKGKKKGGRR